MDYLAYLAYFAELLALLAAGHFLADFPLQSDFMASYKDPSARGPVPWRYVMAGHCATHALVVQWVTGLWLLGVLEFAFHWLTDTAKCRHDIDIHEDQAIHLVCKVVWALATVAYWSI